MRKAAFGVNLSDSSYWLYIIHLPVVTALQVALAPVHVSCWVKFGLVCAVAIPFSLATYQYLVRPTVVGLVLNGRRYPFAWLPWKPDGRDREEPPVISANLAR